MDGNFEMQLQGGLCRARLSGEVTIYFAGELKQDLLDGLNSCLEMELNLSQVEELDTAGVQLLLLLKREAVHAEKSLKLVGHSAAVLEVFGLCRMEAYFGDPLVLVS